MTNPYADIDYKNNFFQYPDLTRIIGEPTTASLITLHTEVKSNAQAVNSPLGGGENGHLGLVVTPEVYATLVPGGTPYVRPVNPGNLIINGDETQYQIAQRRQEHDEATRAFRELIGVERALIQQIVSALEPKYLRALRNPVTGKITKTIPEIFEYLFDTYGDVSPQELRMLTSQVEALTFPPNEPVDTIFAEIDELGTIAELAKAPMSEQQKINMGYLLLQNTQVYTNGLNKWNQRERAEHTWENFKTHFRNAQKALRRTGALTVQETINHAEIVDLVQQGVKLAMAEQNNSVSTAHTTISETQQDSANSITSDITMQTLQAQMEMMRQMMETMKTMQSNSGNNSKKGKRNPNQSKYCWTHGMCSHTGFDCRTPADGHKKEATVENKMGGSMRNVKTA